MHSLVARTVMARDPTVRKVPAKVTHGDRSGGGLRGDRATGVVIRDLPLTPERVWHAIEEAAAGRA